MVFSQLCDWICLNPYCYSFFVFASSSFFLFSVFKGLGLYVATSIPVFWAVVFSYCLSYVLGIMLPSYICNIHFLFWSLDFFHFKLKARFAFDNYFVLSFNFMCLCLSLPCIFYVSRTNMQKDNFSGDASIWLKNKWNPGEVNNKLTFALHSFLTRFLPCSDIICQSFFYN